MYLSTTYLGLKLPHPFMAGASPLSGDMDKVRQLEDAGASAIVLPSLFEEQINQDKKLTYHVMETFGDSYGEALSYFPDPENMKLGPHHYADHLRKVKEAVDVPVIASLNGVSDAGWLDHAKLMQGAGADALEINFYFVATDLDENGQTAEDNLMHIVQHVKQAVSIPIAVKLSPFFSSFSNIGHKLDLAGVDGLILFNRFFQPDIDIEEIEIKPTLHLSDSTELPLRLAWLGILAGRVKASLAVTGGVHTVEDAIKSIMCGADAVQMVSALLKHGPGHLRETRDGVEQWFEEHAYESLSQAKGSLSLEKAPDPAAYQRANYMRLLHSWRI